MWMKHTVDQRCHERSQSKLRSFSLHINTEPVFLLFITSCSLYHTFFFTMGRSNKAKSQPATPGPSRSSERQQMKEMQERIEKLVQNDKERSAVIEHRLNEMLNKSGQQQQTIDQFTKKLEVRFSTIQQQKAVQHSVKHN